MFFCAVWLFAAPLDSGYSIASASASQEDRDRAFIEARYKVINAAETYENTPYRYGGLSRSGVDCSGFIHLSFKDALGVTTPRTSTALYSWTEKIPRDKAQPGDLLFFKTDNSGKVTHVALYLGNGRFIHAASAGAKTGVIYSNLGERYWAQAFAGVGRVFPETGKVAVPPPSDGSRNITRPEAPKEENSRLMIGLAAAPSWASFMNDWGAVRGFASQVRLSAETYTFGSRMVFGLEVRPEYDGALGVFRLPVTFSWGPNDQIMIFAGPVFSFGDASLSTDEGERYYAGGTSWIGAAGLTIAPFKLNTDAGEFAPYLETAWQYYLSEDSNKNTNADFLAGFRFSTGIRWMIQVN